MSTNKYEWHIHILPEDDANRQIARGFVVPIVNQRTIQILNPAGGWKKVIDVFENVHVKEMQNNDYKSIILLIDFDNHHDKRLKLIKNKIPDDLKDRVFILGVLSEPEKLKKEFNGFEKIGASLSQDCSDNTRKTWNHALLKHNKDELDRMVELVKPFLFNQK